VKHVTNEFYSKGRGLLNAGGGWALDFWVPSVESTDHVDRWIIVKQEDFDETWLIKCLAYMYLYTWHLEKADST
jgi:hypothetical protein